MAIASRLDHVWLIRAAVREILKEAQVPEHDIFLLQLAVSEVVSNSIEHGYRSREDGRVDVSLHKRGAELTIDIEDDAPPLAAEHLKQMMCEHTGELEVHKNWSSRGHGLQIVLNTVNSLDVERVGGRNRITLRKRIGE